MNMIQPDSNQHENANNIQQILLEGNYQQNAKVPTRIFSSILKEFKLYYIVAIMMNILMCTLFTVQYFRQCNDPSLSSWMLYSAIIFFCQFIFYLMVIIPSFQQQKSYYFAELLDEVIFEGDQDPYFQLSRKDRIQKRKRIEKLIRSHFKNYKKIYWYIDILLTISDLFLVVLGVVYFSMNDYFKFMLTVNNNESFYQDCQFSSAWITFWSIVLLCISRKNAFQLLLLMVIALPVLVCFVPVKLFKSDKKKRNKNIQCLKILKSTKYHPNQIEGDDHSCSICRMDYMLGASLKVLPCSKLHHFHSGCIKAWIRISPTCPMCRQEIGKIIEDVSSINGAPSYLILENPCGNDVESQNNNINQNAQQQQADVEQQQIAHSDNNLINQINEQDAQNEQNQ